MHNLSGLHYVIIITLLHEIFIGDKVHVYDTYANLST